MVEITYYYTALSLAYFAELTATIATFFIILSLFWRSPIDRDTRQHLWRLVLFLASLCLALWAHCTYESVLPAYRMYFAFLGIIQALMCLFFVEFAYYYPRVPPGWAKELAWVRSALLLFLVFEVVSTVYRYQRLPDNNNFVVQSVLVLLFLAWGIIILLRQCEFTTRHAGSAALQQPGILRSLLRPSVEGAVSRDLALAALTMVGAGAATLAWSLGILSIYERSIFLVSFSMVGVTLMGMTYINSFPAATTLHGKVVVLTSLGIVLVYVAVLLMLAPGIASGYWNATSMNGQQQVQFTPDGASGYWVNQASGGEESQGGEVSSTATAKTLPVMLQAPVTMPLPFAFPFAGKHWSAVNVYSSGAVTFGAPAHPATLLLDPGSTPLITPLFSQWRLQAAAGSQVEWSETPGAVTITWRNVAMPHLPQGPFVTIRLALLSNGAFRFNYDAVDLKALCAQHDLESGCQLLARGVLPGIQGSPVLPLEPGRESSLWLAAGSGGLEQFGVQYRAFLHRELMPIFWLFLALFPLLIFGMSRAFQRTIITPLNHLHAGLQRMDAGDLTTQAPVLHQDEIGTITQFFNGMAANLLTAQRRFERVLVSISDHVYAVRQCPDAFSGQQHYSDIFLSPRIAQITGYCLDEVAPDWVSWVRSIVHPDDMAIVNDHYAALRTESASEVEYRIVSADGGNVWVRDHARVAADEQGQAIYGVISDVSISKMMASTQAELAALRQLDDLRAELISNVSHELRTPLGVIRIASTTLETYFGRLPEATQREVLQTITEQTGLLEQLTADLLDLSRLQRGQIRLHLELIDLGQLLDHIVLRSRQALLGPPGTAAGPESTGPAAVPGGSRGYELQLHLPDQQLRAEVDALRIQQVVENLLSNAIKYSPAGGIVTVTLARSGADRCTITVTDQGIGIAAEEQSRVFETFYRSTHPVVTAQSGLGLGLSISQKLVEAHGGAIHLTSALDRGSSFAVWLPLVQPAPSGQSSMFSVEQI